MTSTIAAFVLLFLLVAGVLTYALSANPKVQELGRLAYGCALLALCFALARVMHLLN